MIPAPPSRPLSAPQANQQSGFSLPPLQAQNTGIQNLVRIPKSDCSSWPEFERYQNAATIHWIQRASKSQSKYGDDEPTSKLWSIQQWCAERLPVPNANWDATWYAAA